jgi:hypothetical protein
VSEVKLFGDGDEVSKMAKLHTDLFDRWAVSILSDQTIGLDSAKRACLVSGTPKPAESKALADFSRNSTNWPRREGRNEEQGTDAEAHGSS